MELGVDRVGDGVGQPAQGLEVVEVGSLDRVDAAQLLDEPLAAGLAEPGDAVERARRHPLAAPLAVERVGEPVGLVADALQHEQRLAPPGDLDRLRAAGHVHLLEALGQRGDRDLVVQPELAHDPLGDTELALAAVDEEQLRRVGELARPLARARRPAGPARRGTP